MNNEEYPILLLQGLCLKESLSFYDLSEYTTIDVDRLFAINNGEAMQAHELLLIILNMALTDADITKCIRYAIEQRGVYDHNYEGRI